MKNLGFTILLVCLSVADLLSALPGGVIKIKGSDTMKILSQKWAEVYTNSHPGVSIKVSSGGTSVGFAALQNTGATLADASRRISAEEIIGCVQAFGKRPTEYKVALDGLSIYANKANPVQVLTLEELGKIFSGQIKNWNEVGGPDAPIHVYGRESTSGTYELLKEQVLRGHDFTRSARLMHGTAELLHAVATDKNGIGYGGAAYRAGAKYISIRKDAHSPAYEPTEDNVENGVYPIWRYLYIYVNPALDKGQVTAYLDWIRSDQGQKIVREVGYFPLPKYLQQNQTMPSLTQN